jgi:hypothetical protein
MIPVFNVVIKVEKGVIYDIVWDNDCFSCLTSSDCLNNTDITYLNDTSIKVYENNCKSKLCTLDADNSFNCDPKFYITWFGTDIKGKQFKSSNLSMSRFRQYAVGSLYNSAKDAFNKTIETLKNTWGDVKKTTDDIIKSFG